MVDILQSPVFLPDRELHSCRKDVLVRRGLSSSPATHSPSRAIETQWSPSHLNDGGLPDARRAQHDDLDVLVALRAVGLAGRGGGGLRGHGGRRLAVFREGRLMVGGHLPLGPRAGLVAVRVSRVRVA